MNTEKEAAEKWCPLGRADLPDFEEVTIGNDPHNVGKDRGGASYCIGSRCMFWRDGGKRAVPQSSKYESVGYCGAAGTPHNFMSVFRT